MSTADVGRLMLIAGAVLLLVGGLFLFGSRFGLGHLPGDMTGTRGNVSFAFPIVTCVIISVVLTVVINLIARLR
jgi:hypothetical protein